MAKKNNWLMIGLLGVGAVILFSKNAKAEGQSFGGGTPAPLPQIFKQIPDGGVVSPTTVLSDLPNITSVPSSGYYYSATPYTQTALSPLYAQKLASSVSALGVNTVQEAIDKTASTITNIKVTRSPTVSTSNLSAAVKTQLSLSSASSVKAGTPTKFDIAVAKMRAETGYRG